MANEDARIRNLRAENYILNQRIATEWIYATDEWKKEARQFCVSGLAEIDMLTEIQQQLGEALKQGIGFSQFKKEIVPYLQQKGWLGADEKAIGSRVQKIFDTNMASANAESLWNSIQETKKRFPYLQYIGSISGEKREEHKPFYGLVAHADDPIWQRIFPPNGYGCKCSVKQLTKGQAERIIKQQEENGGRIVASEEAINKAVDSSFQHSPQALGGLPAYIEQKHNLEVVNKLLEGVLANPKGLATGEEWDIFREGANFVQKNATDFLSDDYKNNPYDVLLRLFKAEKLNIGGMSKKKYFQGNENINNAMDKAISILPTIFVDMCNDEGKIILYSLAATSQKAGSHQLITKELLDSWAKDKRNKPFLDQVKPQEGDSIIKIKPKKDDVSPTCIHEYAHRIQALIPKIDDLYQNIFLRRTQGRIIAPLCFYQDYWKIEDESIMTIKDNFCDAYFGRLYADPKTKEIIKNRGKEVITRSFQFLFTPQRSREFLEKDFELFSFTLGVFLKWGKL